MVRNQAGKKVECGLQDRLHRIGGGSLLGTVVRSASDESKMPRRSRTGYRQICGPQATPELLVYDRGGSAKATRRKLANEGVKPRGMQPQGQGAWLVAEEVRELIRRERGKTAGMIGTLKTDKYGFNKPQERPWQTLPMAGPRSLRSFNLNKRMRDLVQSERALQEAQCCIEKRPAMRERRDIVTREPVEWREATTPFLLPKQFCDTLYIVEVISISLQVPTEPSKSGITVSVS